jgi:hypothetical protein
VHRRAVGYTHKTPTRDPRKPNLRQPQPVPVRPSA